jgi:hypothetical protein
LDPAADGAHPGEVEWIPCRDRDRRNFRRG